MITPKSHMIEVKHGREKRNFEARDRQAEPISGAQGAWKSSKPAQRNRKNRRATGCSIKWEEGGKINVWIFRGSENFARRAGAGGPAFRRPPEARTPIHW